MSISFTHASTPFEIRQRQPGSLLMEFQIKKKTSSKRKALFLAEEGFFAY